MEPIERLAHEFHDGPMQLFTSFQMRLEVLHRLLERDPNPSIEAARRIIDSVLGIMAGGTLEYFALLYGYRALLLIALGLGIAAAGTMSFCVAALVNYLLSSRFVFASGRSAQGFALFFVIALLGLTINLGVTLAGVYLAGLPPVLAKIGGIGTAFLINFALNLRFVFRA